MNILKTTIDGKIVLLPWTSGFEIPEGKCVNIEGGDMLSKDLDELLSSFHSNGYSIEDSLKIVKIMVENVLLIEDERMESFSYWNTLLIEVKDIIEKS